MTSLPKEVSGRQLAGLWGCSDRMVRQLAERGIAVRCGQGKYDLEQSNRNYVDSLRKAAAGRRETEELTPQQRLKTAQAELAEIELQKARGQLLDRDETMADVHRHVLAFRQTLLGSVPTQIVFDVQMLSPHDRDRIKEICRNALWDLVLGRMYAVLGTDSGERCDGCGSVIPTFTENEEIRKANEHLVYPDEREAVLGRKTTTDPTERKTP
jgi:phage terminase Nu1 subunit (DNA packaging protein)